MPVVEVHVYEMALSAHSTLRWVLLVVVVGRAAWAGWSLARGRAYGAPDRAGTATATGLVDLQVLLGLGMWLFLSPTAQQARSDPGAAMGVAPLRFVLVEHPTMMFLAAVVLHVVSVRARRGETDAGRHRTTLFGFLLGLVCLLAGLPRG